LLQYEVIHPQNWPLFQKLVMLCSLPEPASFPIAIRQIVQRVNLGLTDLIPEIAEIASSLITTHSPLRHSSEVANAAYACLALGLTMSDTAVDEISLCDDPVVALLALDCEQRNLTSKPLDKTLWSTHMNGDGLYDEFWILAYEANVKAWLPNTGGMDFVAADPNFSLLKAAGIHFYDATLNMPVPPGGVAVATAPGASAVPAAAAVPTIPTPPATTTVPTETTVPLAPGVQAPPMPAGAVPPAESVVPTDPMVSL
jgi:hypothetical protein